MIESSLSSERAGGLIAWLRLFLTDRLRVLPKTQRAQFMKKEGGRKGEDVIQSQWETGVIRHARPAHGCYQHSCAFLTSRPCVSCIPKPLSQRHGGAQAGVRVGVGIRAGNRKSNALVT